MKRLFLILGISLLPFLNYAQLDSVNIVSYPCFLAAGISGVVTVDTVPGATGYQWISNIGHINSIWFPSGPGPVETGPSVNIYANLSQQVYEICVRAFNATDTTPWDCQQIMGVPAPPVFLSSNSPIANPNDSGYYAVELPPVCPPSGYVWTLSGDVTFNNNSQTISTYGPGMAGTNLNFGPNFTTGTLCVAGITNFGLQSDTVCMVITVPVGIDESETYHTEIFFHPESEKFTVELQTHAPDHIKWKVVDVTGRMVLSKNMNLQAGRNQFSFSTGSFSKGNYFLEIAGINVHEVIKLFIK
jgi:hypothetical protein